MSPSPPPSPPPPPPAPAAGRSSAGISPPAAGSSLEAAGRDTRQTFSAQELAVVLSHYNLGVLDAVQEFPRGSRRSPKMLIRTDAQLVFLLKRRARGREDIRKVAFCHSVQEELARLQFPLPRLIGTRQNNQTMLALDSGTYELFEFIRGNNYDFSLEATTEAGRALAQFHKLLADYKPKFPAPQGSYHASTSVARCFEAVPATLAQAEPDADRAETARVNRFLQESYHAAAQETQDIGLPQWPVQVSHSDWHPGNMLFRGTRVLAVIDYDAARMQQRVLDAANAALQFSIVGGTEDPETWPDHLDVSRFKRFIRGYDSVPDALLTQAELRIMPALMIEALIAESVIPIANTGYFARMPGARFLPMIERKVRWLQKHRQEMVEAVID